MYKTKISQWGLVKNHKASEKEQLARIAKAYRDAGKGIPLLTLRNRAVKMDRVRRFCKQQKILQEIWEALPTESCSKGTTLSLESPRIRHAAVIGTITSALQGAGKPSLSQVFGSRKMSFDPERPLSAASKGGRIELILFHMKMFQKSQIDHTKELITLNRIAMDDLLITWWDKFVAGACLIRRQKPNLGWQKISEACDMAHQILDQRSQSFFRHLLSALDSYNVALQPDLRAHILRFFMKASALKLGYNHPISIVLYHLQEQQILEDVTIMAFEVLMDVARENLDPTDLEVWHLREIYCRILKKRLQWAAAESCGQRFLKQYEDVLGQFHVYSRHLLLGLGCANYEQGLSELAERQLQDVLQRGREDLEDRFSGLGLYVCT
jgi:hypothetical protein